MKIGTLCYIQKDEKTLMIHRNKREDDFHYGKYVAPGGKTKDGESSEECVKREVFEEAGIKVNVIPKGMIIFRNKNRTFSNDIKEVDFKVEVFIANNFEGTPKTSCPEGDITWIDNNKLHDLPMWEGDKVFTEWLDKEGYFEAELFYKDKKLVDHKVKFIKQK